MEIFIPLAGHAAVAYLHFLIAWRFFPQRRENYFAELFWYLMLLYMFVHVAYFTFYIAILLDQKDLKTFITKIAFALIVFAPAVKAALFLGELTEQKNKHNLFSKILAWVSRDNRKLFRFALGISVFLIIYAWAMDYSVRDYATSNFYALYLAAFMMLWLIMFLAGFRPKTNKHLSRQKTFGVVIALLLIINFLPMIVDMGYALSLVPIICTVGISLVFCWYRLRTQFMDTIFNQFIRILMLIAVVTVLTYLTDWMNIDSLNTNTKMSVIFCLILIFSLMFTWVNKKLTLLWQPPTETLALVHSELPRLLAKCPDGSSSIAQTEAYLSTLFSAKVAINRSQADAVQSVSLGGEIPVRIELGYLKNWMPWFSEALHWVHTAGVYLQSHLKVINALEIEYKQQLRAEELTSLAVKAELSAMRSQIRPHFLFNILNSIHSFIQTEPERAEQTIEILSDIMRSVLSMSDKDEVTLSQELIFAEKYLMIEKIRYGEQFDYQVMIEPHAKAIMIPPFSVQPLVENAIKHAVDAQFDPVFIKIKVSTDKEQLIIQVIDDGPGLIKHATSRGLGLALYNIKSRLQILYGDKSELKLQNRPEKGVVASINIPMTEQDIS